ncbi:hypothetical protein ACFXD5_39480 [Streptomyces sp. NPDC059385]|uniref:hypothetical protein n=1 Tax=Streptomyces sp. NPDC059385 TaxID=3346817 RepID=UPI0036BF42C1
MGTHLRAGQRLTASLLTAQSAQSEDTTSRTTTSTSYGNASGGAFSASVVVPASGWVMVEMRATQRNSTTNNTITSWNASGSTSGTVYTANDIAALIVNGTQNQAIDLSYRLASLVPGETLTVTMQHKVNAASTGTYDYRQIILVGMP